MSHIKKAETVHPVLDIIKNRWSPRSFSEKPILILFIHFSSCYFLATNPGIKSRLHLF